MMAILVSTTSITPSYFRSRRNTCLRVGIGDEQAESESHAQTCAEKQFSEIFHFELSF
jgi:hypothetical protein